MLPPSIFLALLLLICGYALWCGRGDERLAALVCLGATAATHFAVSPLRHRYKSVESGLLAIDLLVLAAFVAIALRSKRFWPLWAAGFQLTMSMAHLLKLVAADLLPQAYAAAAIFWSYPILLILAIGTIRCRRQDQRRGEQTELAA